MLFRSDDKIAEKRVDLGDQRGADWIVLGGIDAGERVVVSGIQKAEPGGKVKPMPYQVPTEAASAGATAN